MKEPKYYIATMCLIAAYLNVFFIIPACLLFILPAAERRIDKPIKDLEALRSRVNEIDRKVTRNGLK